MANWQFLRVITNGSAEGEWLTVHSIYKWKQKYWQEFLWNVKDLHENFVKWTVFFFRNFFANFPWNHIIHLLTLRVGIVLQNAITMIKFREINSLVTSWVKTLISRKKILIFPKKSWSFFSLFYTVSIVIDGQQLICKLISRNIFV